MDPTITKPSRSDDVLDPEQQLKIADHVKSLFESTAPKRPIKPSRSESDTVAPPLQSDYIASIPELEKLKSLKSRSEVVFARENGGVSGEDEYTETEYYNELASVDKQHHTTGTGFINVIEEDQSAMRGNYRFAKENKNGEVRKMVFSDIRCNPATNDWTPAVDGSLQVLFASAKPTRSG